MSLDAAIVVVGDEMLAGRRADANGRWLAARLTAAGARVVGLEIVGDRVEPLAQALCAAAGRARVVLVSGGLGPTVDDATREGIARAAGVDLVEDEGALASIAALLARRGLAVDAGRQRQALVPRGGAWLANAHGTAPGLEVRIGSATVWALPGVPRELKGMYEDHVAPGLVATGALETVEEAVVPTAGIPEAEVGRRLEDLARAGDPEVGFYPHEGEVEIRLLSRGEGAGARVAAAEAEVRRRLGPAAWRSGPIEQEVIRQLRERGLSVTTAESMTGGLVARMLTAVPGASDVLPGGWVTYSDPWKRDALGVSPGLLEERGAVSPEVARAMAEGALERAGTDTAVAVTGFAGPGDGVDPRGHPVPAGTFHVAVARRGGGTAVRSYRIPIERRTVQRRAAVAVLDLLRRSLEGTLTDVEAQYSEGSG